MDEPTVWGIHAGASGEADALFTEGNVVAVDWPKMGDLGQWKTVDAFKAAIKGAYPDTSDGSLAIQAGMLHRFVRKMAIGDYVVYPRKATREVWIGEVTGDYNFHPDRRNYRFQRAVKWLAKVPRVSLSQGALYTIGAAMALFRVQNYADEFIALARGEALPATDEDDTILEVSRDIEVQTQDFILKRLARHLKGHPFAEFVADLLSAMGYQTRVSPPGPDHGIDIIAHPDELGFRPPIIKVQIKSTEGSVGEPAVAQLYGTVEPSEFGLFVTLGGFTPSARSFGLAKSNLRLIDGEALVELVLAHYEELDARHKGIIPLRRAYIPEAIEERSNGV